MAERRAPYRNKYGAIPTEVDGIKFASRAEARRYGDLALLQEGGLITDLVCHPKFEIKVNGMHVCYYVADFQYMDGDKLIVEDVKSSATVTKLYLLKKKLMKACHGISVRESYS
jgi:hypothetical protein